MKLPRYLIAPAARNLGDGDTMRLTLVYEQTSSKTHINLKCVASVLVWPCGFDRVTRDPLPM